MLTVFCRRGPNWWECAIVNRRTSADDYGRLLFLLCFPATVVTFFIVGLLYLLCLKHIDNLGPTASRRRPAFSSPLVTSVAGSQYPVRKVGRRAPGFSIFFHARKRRYRHGSSLNRKKGRNGLGAWRRESPASSLDRRPQRSWLNGLDDT